MPTDASSSKPKAPPSSQPTSKFNRKTKQTLNFFAHQHLTSPTISSRTQLLLRKHFHHSLQLLKLYFHPFRILFASLPRIAGGLFTSIFSSALHLCDGGGGCPQMGLWARAHANVSIHPDREDIMSSLGNIDTLFAVNPLLPTSFRTSRPQATPVSTQARRRFSRPLNSKQPH